VNSTVKDLVIWGAGGHAAVVADIVRRAGQFRLVGFIEDLNESRAGTEFCGVEILGGRTQLLQLHAGGVKDLLVAVGNCRVRLALALEARRMGFTLAVAIHPRATVAEGVHVGAGTVIAAGAVVNPGAKLGECVIVNTCASVDHDCVVEDGAHLCPGVRLAGSVTVGRGAWVGLGSVVTEGLWIGTGTMIGAGAVVVRDIPEHVLAYGVPARVIRHLEEAHGEAQT
jgi:acetyltransferase EpsM